MPLIQLTSLTKNHLNTVHSGVTDINLKIERGEIVSIIGESGSGKSTLLNLIYGILIPQSGEVLFNGAKVLGPDEKLIAGHDQMKMVTQQLNLNLYAKVYDNIAGLLSNINLEEKRELTQQTMEFLCIDHLSDKRIVDLSGGEQQRVALARAVITEPDVLLLDEPFSQVDAILKNQLREDIHRLSKYLNITVILVSHEPSDGLSIADQMVILKDGRIIAEGKPKDIYENPKQAYVAKLLGKANILTNLKLLPNPLGKYAVYPQSIILNRLNKGFSASVKNVYFCGNLEEIEINYISTKILAYDYEMRNFKKGETVWFTVNSFLNLE
jgi:ABC-type sugar transport system ATPase subunit